MSTPLDKLRISQLSLYNPGRMSDEEVVAAFAARQALFERMLADVRTEKPRGRPQHHLIVGQRGMGKSLLLARLGAELRRDHELAAVFIPLVFAEEQYAVDRLSKFWLNCLDSLADACERAGDTTATDRIDAIVHQLSSPHLGADSEGRGGAGEPLNAFLAEAKVLKRRPVLLVDNLQLVFERISDQEQHVLRELLMRPGAPILIGTSPSPPPANRDYGAAFYDHFKVHYLPALSVEEMRQLLLTLAAKVERPDIRDRVLRHPHRLSVLRQLTGGNPRTAVTLFFLYAEDLAPTVFGDLENLLDRVTPLYKARFEELSPQQQVVASAVANHWDPITARAIADRTGLAPTAVSPQLDRLEKIGFVERVELFGESSFGYQIAERFFNVWFLMRTASRRQRREVEFLTRFIEAFYEGQDRSRLARLLQGERDFSPDRHLFMRALVPTLEPAEAHDLCRHADLDALGQKDAQLRRRLAEVIDFTQLPPATRAFAELRGTLLALVPPDGGVEPEDFAHKVLGDRRMFVSGDRERLATRGQLSVSELQTLLGTIEESRKADEERFGRDAVDWLSHRLGSGQLAALESDEDWKAAFAQAPGPAVIRLLLRVTPNAVGVRISRELSQRLQGDLEPAGGDSALAWHNWGFAQEEFCNQPAGAEAAYRQAIALDPKYAWPWNSLGLLLRQHNRPKDAETAYLQAIVLDAGYAAPWYNLGRLLGELERYNEAEVAFRRAIALDPKDAWTWDYLGDILVKLRRHQDAEAAYRQAIAMDPKNAVAWTDLGALLLELNRTEEAEAACREAIALDPKDAWPWDCLGDLLIKLGRHQDAEAAYRQAIAMDPKNAVAWTDLGALLLELNRTEEAEAACREAIALDPKDAWPWDCLGDLLIKLGRHQDAEAAYRQAIAMDPKNAVAWTDLGALLLELNRTEEAEAAWREAIALNPKSAWPWLLLGAMLARLSRIDEAEAAFRHAVALDPKAAWPRVRLGNLLQKLDRHEEAEAAYRQAIALDPKGPWPWVRLGNLLQKLDRHEEAEAAYRQAIALDPKDPWPWDHLGDLLAKIGRKEEAEAAYRRAVVLAPNSYVPVINLGGLLAELGRYEEAETAYRQAAELDPADGSIHDALGDLLGEKLARHAEAADAYREALARDPEDTEALVSLGNLCTDFLRQYAEAERAFMKSMEVDDDIEVPLQNLVSLRRDFCGDLQAAKPLLEQLSQLKELTGQDLYHLHCGISAAYESDWVAACAEFAKALDLTRDGIPPLTTIGWMRTSAVLIHLNLGEPFLAFLRERGDDLRLRPWYEALAALQAGDRRHLQNVAPEIRPIAEAYFDQIEKRLNNLPEQTRRRVVPVPSRPRNRTRKSRSRQR